MLVCATTGSGLAFRDDQDLIFSLTVSVQCPWVNHIASTSFHFVTLSLSAFTLLYMIMILVTLFLYHDCLLFVKFWLDIAERKDIVSVSWSNLVLLRSHWVGVVVNACERSVVRLRWLLVFVLLTAIEVSFYINLNLSFKFLQICNTIVPRRCRSPFRKITPLKTSHPMTWLYLNCHHSLHTLDVLSYLLLGLRWLREWRQVILFYLHCLVRLGLQVR